MLADTKIFGGRTASRPVPRRGASKNAVRTSMLAHPHPRSPACRRVARMAAASAPDAYVSLLLVLLRYSDNPSFSWSSVWASTEASTMFPHTTNLAFIFPWGALTVVTSLPGAYSTSVRCFRVSRWTGLTALVILVRLSYSDNMAGRHIARLALTSWRGTLYVCNTWELPTMLSPTGVGLLPSFSPSTSPTFLTRGPTSHTQRLQGVFSDVPTKATDWLELTPLPRLEAAETFPQSSCLEFDPHPHPLACTWWLPLV